MTDNQREILLHTLGMNMTPKGPPHRNYFNANPSGRHFDDCMALVALRLMRRGREAPGGSIYFHATPAGIQAAVGLAVPMADIEAWIMTGQWPRRRRR